MALTTSLADLSVLLVEPSQMQAHVVTRMLQNLEVRKLHVVDTAAAALSELQGGEWDVAISSLYLPDMPDCSAQTSMGCCGVSSLPRPCQGVSPGQSHEHQASPSSCAR